MPVLHAMRPYGAYYPNLGRDAFLASVTGEDGSPIINLGAGRVLAESPRRCPRIRGRRVADFHWFEDAGRDSS